MATETRIKRTLDTLLAELRELRERAARDGIPEGPGELVMLVNRGPGEGCIEIPANREVLRSLQQVWQ